MQVNDNKATVAVLVHIPRKLYKQYLKTLGPRQLKTQSHNTSLMQEAIEREVLEFKKKEA